VHSFILMNHICWFNTLWARMTSSICITVRHISELCLDNSDYFMDAWDSDKKWKGKSPHCVDTLPSP